MSMLAVVALSFATGVIAAFAVLARVIRHNRRRIERLERRLKAHEAVIRRLAEESIDPDGPIPPPRPVLRVVKGGAAVGVLVALIRARPARTAFAAGTVAAATALAVAVTVLPPPVAGTRALGAASTVASVQAPASTLSPSGAPSPPRAVPSGPPTRSASAPTVTGASSTAAASATTAAPVASVAVSLLSDVPSIPSLPLSTGSVLPSVSVPAIPTATLSLPAASATGTCLIGLQVPPLVDVCVP